jgi:predicted dehydrogenase
MARIPVGMVGGGPGAFIGAVHRMALALDGRFELAAGCFSGDPAKSHELGRSLGLPRERCYGTWSEMARSEAARAPGDRIAAVAIVTPNHLHHGPAKAFLEAGIHVICDKPLAISLDEALDLEETVRRTGCVFALTHNYTGYPLVREAREIIGRGELGQVRKVFVEYLQGWLSEPLERTGHKQASWRTDPAKAGPAGALGDIGTHAFHLVEHVLGARVLRLLAVMKTFVQGRRLDDDDMCLLEIEGGATGSLLASQVCFGRENALALRVFGTRGALSWRQEHPNDLEHTGPDGTVRVLRAATAATGSLARGLTRLPPGHPEGYIEAFANIYRAFARAIQGEPDIHVPFPTAGDGVRGLRFLAAALESARTRTWVDV